MLPLAQSFDQIGCMGVVCSCQQIFLSEFVDGNLTAVCICCM